MKNRKPIYSLILFSLILTLVLAGIIFYSKKQDLRVVFLDVGQGDATLITRGSYQILIDGGPSDEIILEKLGHYVPFWDRRIEILIATHPDSDHIHGLTAVLENYRVEKVLDNGNEADSQIFKKYEKLLAERRVSRETAETGMNIKIGEGADLEIIHPDRGFDFGENSNSAGIAGKLIFREDSFLIMGDLPIERESALIKNGSDLKARFLKAGHHGSKYSTGPEFLEAVRPKTAIISVGKNNRYGHPSPEALERLRAKNVDILRTDEIGDIGYVCKESEENCFLGF